MYCGHTRLCVYVCVCVCVCLSVCLSVCLCVCMSAAAFLHYCRDPDVTWGRGRGCPLVVHYIGRICNRRTDCVAVAT